ncbi:TauD/TfdA family dioxygenase [Candidatus Woesearchaeota archaeon]|nr:TauD/TfdA family dioxygenase [Candidatus Woesearchaeota archaeon]
MQNIPQSFPTEKVENKRSWNRNSDFSHIVHVFSKETQDEIRDYLDMSVTKKVLGREEIESVDYNPNELSNLVSEIESVRPQVDTGTGFVVFPDWEGLTIHQSRVASWLVDNTFGKCKEQDDRGSRLIEIYNQSDTLSMKTGARYHVTREGNSPHTDGPQIIDDPDYLCLRCVNDAWVGGENILVTGESIYNNLLENASDLIGVLSDNFYFHCRGVKNAEGREYFQAPILSMDKEGIRLRFLDHYIREGHKFARTPLTYKQEKAIQYINSLFEQSDLQFRARLEPGQQVVFANKRMLHARTEFVDLNPANEHYDPSQLDNIKTANRLMDRTWTYKR